MGPMVYGKDCTTVCSCTLDQKLAMTIDQYVSTNKHADDASSTVRHLVSQERLPFTATYFGSIALTLWFALGVCLLRTPLLRLLLTTSPDQKYHTNSDVVDRSACGAGVVSDKLFPHGLDWSSLCCTVRWRSSYGLDEWLIVRASTFVSFTHKPVTAR